MGRAGILPQAGSGRDRHADYLDRDTGIRVIPAARFLAGLI